MNRDYFEILSLLAGGNAEKMADMFLMYKAYTGRDYEHFKKAVHTVVIYGLVERLDMSLPLFTGSARVKLTNKGFDSLDTYEEGFYKGTMEGKFIDSEFLGV